MRRTSESLTDAQPTFDAIAVNATRLCHAVNDFVFRYDGELIHVAAYHNVGGDELDAIRGGALTAVYDVDVSGKCEVRGVGCHTRDEITYKNANRALAVRRRPDGA
jgi:two-component system, NtrC family, sensor kinase